MRNMIDRVLIISVIIINTLGRLLPDRGYFICDSISLTLAAVFFCNNTKRTNNIIAQWALILAINNLLDELFFNPCVLGWNEIILLILASIRAYMQYMKQNGRHKG